MKTMTLSDIRDWHRRQQKNDDAISGNVSLHARMADAIDAHLTPPAQAVDVWAIAASVADAAWSACQEDVSCKGNVVAAVRDALTAALPNANGKEG